MAKLTSMVNIGREMERKLRTVGIESPEQLREMGAQGAYLRLKLTDPRVCLVHLYALEGAVQGVAFNNLSPETKAELKNFCDQL